MLTHVFYFSFIITYLAQLNMLHFDSYYLSYYLHKFLIHKIWLLIYSHLFCFRCWVGSMVLHPHLAMPLPISTMTEDSNDDFTRNTRSRSNSLSTESGASILDFSKPFSVDTPGCYRLSSAESGCTISLFHDVLSKHHCELLLSEIDAHGKLQQYSSLHRNQFQPLPRLSAWYGPVDYAYSGVVMKGYPVIDCPRVVSAFQNIAANILEPNNID